MNTPQTEAAIALLRDLATRLETGEVEAGKIQIIVRDQNEFDSRRYEIIEVEVRTKVVTKNC